jgi:hypothetical protein
MSTIIPVDFDAVPNNHTILLPVDALGSWVEVNEGPTDVQRHTANRAEDGTITAGSSVTLTASTYLSAFNASLRLYRGPGGGIRSRVKLGKTHSSNGVLW